MGEITYSHFVSGQCLVRTLFPDPSRGVISLNPPGPEGSKGRWALIGARGVPFYVLQRANPGLTPWFHGFCSALVSLESAIDKYFVLTFGKETL